MSKQVLYSGFQSIMRLRQVLKSHGIHHVFLVRSKKSFSLCGAESILHDLLSGLVSVEFCDFSENLKKEEVDKGIRLFLAGKYDCILAVGGGSVLDMAKLIRAFAREKCGMSVIIRRDKHSLTKGPLLIAIPTTAGSGSEATHFAVLYDGVKKYSLGDPLLLPDIVIIDPQFTLSLPPYLTASTGMDALSQAIESYWSIHSCSESKRYSIKAIRLIVNYLVKAVANPDRKARHSMAMAAHYAGQAINITKTTAPHAISYALTTFFGINHGHAAALTLGEIFLYNSRVKDNDNCDPRGSAYVRAAIGKLSKELKSRSALEARQKIKVLMDQIVLETRFGALGIKTEKDISLILDNVNTERMRNNPRAINRESLTEILQKLRRE